MCTRHARYSWVDMYGRHRFDSFLETTLRAIVFVSPSPDATDSLSIVCAYAG
jgi:hypothetical protein